MKPANAMQESLIRRRQQVEALMNLLASFLKRPGIPVDVVRGVRDLLAICEKSLVELQTQSIRETWGRKF